MITKRRQSLIHMLLSLSLVFILLFSGCTNQKEPTKEDTNLPSLQRQQLVTIKEQSFNWFNQHFNMTTGGLDDVSEPLTITDYILTANVLISYAYEQASFTASLNKTIDEIIQEYKKDSVDYSLLTYAQSLSVLCTAPLSFSSQSIRDELADQIISYQQNVQFNSTAVFSPENALALNALMLYDQNNQNETMHEILIQLIYSYYQTLNSYYEEDQIDDINYFDDHGYFNHYFTKPLINMQTFNIQSLDPHSLIYRINEQLSQFQDTQNNQTIGLYKAYNNTDPIFYQIQAIQTMSTAYNLSKTQGQSDNKTMFRQSLILGLIYLKNQVLQDNTIELSVQDHLSLLPVIQQVLMDLPSENWTYLWDSTNQLLLEGRELETSPTLWTALSIGVMGSIGLIALVFIVIQLYYKNKK